MKKKPRRRADNNRFYTASQAGRFLNLTAESVKRRCRDGDIKGERAGPKKQWLIEGLEINRKIDEWNLDLLDH
jgi:hypothetical protein